jgi:hypothetical protein
MNSKLHVEAHLTEELLIRFLDGELDKRASETAARHLDSCWTCRSKREQLRQAMDRFVQLEEALIDASITTPPRAWAGFRDRLSAAGQQAPSSITPLPLQLMYALGMFGAAFALALWLLPPSSVSAMEILERSAASERPLLQGRPNPLVLQRLRVESAHRAASWSLWNAPQSRKFQEKWDASGDNRLRADLEGVYAANGLDLKHPLSAANHSHWRHSLKQHNDSVLQQGDLLGVVTTSNDPAQPGEITEAEIWVRRSDWHPVRQAFRVAGAGETEEYRIVETAFHVETLDSENARIFDPAPPAIESASVRMHSAAASIAEPSSAPAVYAPAQTELIETEIEALALLHEMDADRQDSAEVRRGDSSVIVTAYTSSQDRKLELESHLAAMPLVTSAIHLLSDSPPIVSTSGAPVSIAIASSSASEPPLFLKPLVERTGSLEIANRIVSDQMDLLRRLCIELEAAQSLEKRFPAEIRSSLPPRSLSRLDGLALDHLDAARHVWLELERNTGPLLVAVGAPARDVADTATSCGEWYRPRALPTDAAQRFEDLYARAFTALAGAPSDISQQSIVAELPELRAKLKAELAEGCLR